jgi:hypothetical protein
MEVTIREEAGYDLALYGFSLSYKDRAIKPVDWWSFVHSFELADPDDDCELEQRRQRTEKTATANAGRGKGHDKFLRQIMVWVDIEAPRYWWSEFDTYKVGTVAQSESTMHTLSKRDMSYGDIHMCDEYDTENVDVFNSFREARPEATIADIKRKLPESYLQRRLVTMNYAVLRCIIEQRKNHKLFEWQQFINAIYTQAAHKELLPKQED